MQGGVLASGVALAGSLSGLAKETLPHDATDVNDLYELFKNPPAVYRPFVRWWWNGNKVNKEELARELSILKNAGIGGVEITPFLSLAEQAT